MLTLFIADDEYFILERLKQLLDYPRFGFQLPKTVVMLCYLSVKTNQIWQFLTFECLSKRDWILLRRFMKTTGIQKLLF